MLLSHHLEITLKSSEMELLDESRGNCVSGNFRIASVSLLLAGDSNRDWRYHHGSPRRCASESASMAAACRRGWAWQTLDSRLELSEQLQMWRSQWKYHLRTICTLVREWQRLNNSCGTSFGDSTSTVIFDGDPKSMIGCPSGRRAVQSFMTAEKALSPATNSFSWIGCSGKVAGKVFPSAIFIKLISKYLRLTQGIRFDTGNRNKLLWFTLKWVRVGRCMRWSNTWWIGMLLLSNSRQVWIL